MRRGKLAGFRVTALLCVLLLSLASGRGLVAGLCANLVAEDTLAALPVSDAYVGPAATCCIEGARAGQCPVKDDSGHRPLGQRDCAFCTLALARVEPLELVTLPEPPTELPTAIVVPEHSLEAQETTARIWVRGPPAVLFS
ncbi:MAG: hypothetical protein GC168_18085 [Candidatus Hydrogenedens sp.]|nr:hypothetical protein [Candidatus Hydrogenedens sp.]